MSRRDELAQIAYAEQARWLLASGIISPPWDQLEPGTQEMFRREAGAVAAAERDRILRLLGERFKTVMLYRDSDYPVDGVPWSVLVSVLKSGTEAREGHP